MSQTYSWSDITKNAFVLMVAVLFALAVAAVAIALIGLGIGLLTRSFMWAAGL